MATPIHCDYTDCGELADVMVSRLADGQTLAWCDPHFLAMSVAIAEAAAQAEADATAAQAEERLGGVADPAEPPTSAASSDAGDPPAEPPTNAVDGPPRPARRQSTRTGRNGRPGASTAVLDEPGDPDPGA